MKNNSLNAQFILSKLKITPVVLVSTVTLLILFSIIYTFKNRIPAKRQEPTKLKAQATLAASDKKPGCVFSLRFDSETTGDSTIKAEAREELNGIRTQLLTGKAAQDLIQEILYSGGEIKREEQLREFMEKRRLQQSPKIPIAPYSRFNPGSSPIFCFSNPQELTTNLGKPFIEENPTIISTFNLLNPGDVSEPFIIYKSAHPRPKEYAWMITIKLQ